ncbi:MAG: MBL fold metallo-hydrolase [Acidobacteriia bacterium]|nr:MBL fold metallo-hydrolase [Terriglobia bacterium]
MRIAAVLALVTLALQAQAQDKDLSITWVGQSCFLLRTPSGPTVLTDPPVASVGYTLPSLAADVVTITHNHTDHNNSAGVRGSFTLVDGRPVTGRQVITAAALSFTLIPGFHDNQNGALRGPNTMIRWTQAGLNIAHLGDLGQDSLTDAQAADLQNVDILFIPAGGFFTITPERAAAYVSQLHPRIAILMHYRTALGGPAQLGTLPSTAAPFSPLLYKPSTVVVHRDALPVSQEVWVMQPASDATVVNAATFAEGNPVAPGSVLSVFGAFSASQTAAATAYPLPRKLGETEVLIDGTPAPLFYVSPAQINVQLPAGHTAGPVLADVHVAGQSVGHAPSTVVPSAPGLFAAANQDYRPNSPSLPAHPGEILQIYGTGQGAVVPAVDDGVAASAAPLSLAVPPNVFLEGRQLTVQFSGLAPGLAGVWQINVVLPPDAPTGPSLALTVVNGLVTSNRLAVAIVRQ